MQLLAGLPVFFAGNMDPLRGPSTLFSVMGTHVPIALKHFSFVLATFLVPRDNSRPVSYMSFECVPLVRPLFSLPDISLHIPVHNCLTAYRPKLSSLLQASRSAKLNHVTGMQAGLSNFNTIYKNSI